MTISRKIIDQNEVVDLWRLESNDFDEWEVGSIPIPSIKDSFEVRFFFQYFCMFFFHISEMKINFSSEHFSENFIVGN